MNKLFAGVSLLLAMLLSACGDNGVRSPDFDSQLIDIVVEGPVQAQVDQFAQMRALGHFTAPPSQGGAEAIADITGDVDWRVVNIETTSGSSPDNSCQVSNTPSDKATVNAAGLVHALAVGTIYVKAIQKGVPNPIVGCKPFTITPGSGGGGPSTVVLQGLRITPDNPTIPAGTDQQFHVQGFYSDAPTTARDLNPGTEISWSSSNPSVATIAVQQGNSTVANAHGVAAGNTVITASTVNSAGTAVSDTTNLTVGAGVVKSILRVEPPEAKIVISFSQQFVACGTFSDGTGDSTGPCSANPSPGRQGLPAGHVIPNDQLVWTSSDHDVADNPTPNTASSVLATGKAEGDTIITAAFRTTDSNGNPVQIGDPAPANRSASATLHVVTGPLCVKEGALLATNTIPGFAPKAEVTVERGVLCLACAVDNPDLIIDEPPFDEPSADETYAEMSVTLGALDILGGQGYIQATVHAQTLLGLPFPLATTASTANPAHGVGFIIERPAGELATADVLAQATIITTRNGVEAQNFSGGDDTTNGGSDTLTVDLLGSPLVPLGIPANERFILYTSEITKPFDAISLRFAPGVAGALATLDVFNVCTDVQVAPPDTQ